MAQGARSSNAKEMALLQKSSEMALEYQTCADTWWALESDYLRSFDTESGRALGIYATQLQVAAQMQKLRYVLS